MIVDAHDGEPITLPVIGVVGNARLNGPESEAGAEVLLPYTLEVWPWMRFAVRAATPEQMLRTIESGVREVEPGVEFLGRPSVAPAGMAAVDAGRRFLTMVLAGFALAALVGALVGDHRERELLALRLERFTAHVPAHGALAHEHIVDLDDARVRRRDLGFVP